VPAGLASVAHFSSLSFDPSSGLTPEMSLQLPLTLQTLSLKLVTNSSRLCQLMAVDLAATAVDLTPLLRLVPSLTHLMIGAEATRIEDH
jgi:hypothetical protein